jgi:hypothetical protein
MYVKNCKCKVSGYCSYKRCVQACTYIPSEVLSVFQKKLETKMQILFPLPSVRLKICNAVHETIICLLGYSSHSTDLARS